MAAAAAFVALHAPLPLRAPRRSICRAAPRAPHRPAPRRPARCVETPPQRTPPQQTEETAAPLSATPPPPPPPHAAHPHLAESPRTDINADILWTGAFVGLAAAVAAGVAAFKGTDRALEFVTAYIVEYSLSVDNLFVFLLIFSFFKVPRRAQLRVLSFGIGGAVVMRGVMIAVGEALTHRFRAVSVAFAALLLFSAGKLLLTGEDDEDEDLEQNAIVKFSRSLLPFSDHYDGDRFFTRTDGARLATPLMLVLLSVEFSDVVFALDSVPAVLGISDDTLVIYVSNILAIMGLRNLFFVLSDAIGDLRFLRQALAVVLGFVGAKMITGVAGYHIDTLPSLGVVVGTLAAGVGFSFAFPGTDEAEVPK